MAISNATKAANVNFRHPAPPAPSTHVSHTAQSATINTIRQSLAWQIPPGSLVHFRCEQHIRHHREVRPMMLQKIHPGGKCLVIIGATSILVDGEATWLQSRPSFTVPYIDTPVRDTALVSPQLSVGLQQAKDAFRMA